MTKILNVLVVFMVIFVISCKKSEDYVITGRLVEDCQGNIPAAYQTFHLLSRTKPYSEANGMNIPFTTDANGNFSVVYNSDNLAYSGIFIKELFEDKDYQPNQIIHPMTNFDLGDFTTKSTFSFKLNFIFYDQFSAGDTLYMHDEQGELLLAIPAPFENNQYGPFTRVEMGNYYLKEDGYYHQTKISLTSNIDQVGSTLSAAFKFFKEVKYCDQTEQTFDLVIH